MELRAKSLLSVGRPLQDSLKRGFLGRPGRPGPPSRRELRPLRVTLNGYSGAGGALLRAVPSFVLLAPRGPRGPRGPPGALTTLVCCAGKSTMINALIEAGLKTMRNTIFTWTSPCADVSRPAAAGRPRAAPRFCAVL
jgi:hypothetical protein